MFDQKWLKRYMLQNRPNGEDATAILPGGGGGGLQQQKAPRPAELPLGRGAVTEPVEDRWQAPGGDPLEVTAVYDVTCPRCGNVYKSDAHYCRKCGHKRSDASVVVSRPAAPEANSHQRAAAAAEANGRAQQPPSRMQSSEPPWGYPPGQQRIPLSGRPDAAMSPSPMGFAQSRSFAPESSGNKYNGYGGARPSDAPPPSYGSTAAPSPMNPLPRSMSHRSEVQPPRMALSGMDTADDGRANYWAKGADRNRDGIPEAMQAPMTPGPGPGAGGPAPWPMMGGGFQGPYGQFPYDANANQYNLWPTNYGGEGGGAKNYVVLCKDDVEVRASPTYSDDARIGQLLHPGQVVVCDERRMVNGAWFLHLADGRGWVFETKERLLVMTEVQDFERGLWHYSIVCEDDVETRISPTYSDDSRTGIILGSGDTVAVDERCCVAGSRFLKLADGRGWVFETRDRLLVFSEVRSKPQEARDFERGLWHYTVVCDDDVEIRAAPTYSDEARTGLMVHPGDCVAVDERCRVAAVWYLRLSDGRGWVFESKDSRRVMMQLH